MAPALRWATFLAPALRELYQMVAARVAAEVGVTVDLVDGGSYAEVAAGGLDMAFICGLPYIGLTVGLLCALNPIAAAVPDGRRYNGRPVYFSDVVVPAGSAASSFADLRGGRWAYNERGSHSGYLVTLRHLASLGEDTGYFREWVEAGFHEECVRRVADGTVDGAAVDSHLLDVLLARHPALRQQLRVVEALGPYTSQPLVSTPGVPDEVQRAVRAAVTRVGEMPGDREIMKRARVQRFVGITDADYDEMRRALDLVRMSGLWTSPRPDGLAAVD